MRVEGNPPVVRSINGRALKQRGVPGESLAALREAHRLLFVLKLKLEEAATSEPGTRVKGPYVAETVPVHVEDRFVDVEVRG